VRILYFSKSYSTHDLRFLKKISSRYSKVFFLRLEKKNPLEPRPLPKKVDEINWIDDSENLSFLSLAFRLKQILHYYKPDLIHAGPIQEVTFLCALTGFKPIVAMSWGSDILLKAERSLLSQWITKFTLSRSSVLISDCKAVSLKAISLGFQKERIFEFPWGVDLSSFIDNDSLVREKLGWEENFILLSVRSWEPIYGIDILLKAFSIIVRKHPNVRLILLGDGSLSSKIKEFIKKQNIIDFVYLGGRILESELPQYYKASNIYVSCSYSDGSSVSLLGALASGCPAIVSDIPSNREWISNGVQGFLFKTGCFKDLAKTIEFILKNKNLLTDMSKKAKKLARERADWDLNSEKLFSAYDSVSQHYT